MLVVYPHLPHYRYGVFDAMRRDPEIDYEFIAGDLERSGTIEMIPPSQVPYERVKNIYLGRPLWQRGLLSRLLRSRPDAVIFLGDCTYVTTWIAALILRVKRVPVLYWTIGWHRPESGPKRLIRLAFYRLGDRLLLYGTVGFELGIELGYPESRMTVIGNSYASSKSSQIDQAEADRVGAALESVHPTVLVAVVRHNSAKRLDLLIEVAARLADSGMPVSVVLAGGGPEEEALRRQADELGVDARFLGPVYSAQALDLIYRRASLTVLPAAAGLTVMQSLENGIPVITDDNPYTQMPEAEAVRPGVTGDTYKAGSVEDMERVIQRWLTSRVADDSAVSQACIAEIESNWTGDQHAKRISAAVREVAHAPPASSSER